jgi:predicted enzyme related to lactoylglutathione lyase
MNGTFCHWEIMTKDIKKSETFYTSLFGWKIAHSMGPDYGLVDTGQQPGGGIMKWDDFTPGGGVMFYFLVDDCAKFLDKAVSLGGTKIREKTEIPQVGWFSLFGDPDGNCIGLFESLKK